MRGEARRQGLVLLVVGLAIASIFLNSIFYFSPSNEWISLPDFPSPLCNKIQSDGNINKTIVTSVPKIFHCEGYAINRNFQPTLQSIFPEYEWHNLQKETDWKSLQSHPWDLMVSNYQLDECRHLQEQEPSFHRWLQLQFQGKNVFWTPEDATNYQPIAVRHGHFYELGPGEPRTERLTLTFLQTAFWAQLDLSEKQQLVSNHPRSQQQQPRPHFLIYANSNCVPTRQQAFRQIANAGFPTVHYGGHCHGGVKKNQTKAERYPNKVRLSNWQDNRQIYQQFRFCLTMEHTATPGYITEKILVAFWAGCIPIYWGPMEIMDMFNPKAFVFWDPEKPETALERIRYLETNRTAYGQVLQQPILAPGALKKYFSLDDDFGGGILKARIRRFLGLEAFEFLPNIILPNN